MYSKILVAALFEAYSLFLDLNEYLYSILKLIKLYNVFILYNFNRVSDINVFKCVHNIKDMYHTLISTPMDKKMWNCDELKCNY